MPETIYSCYLYLGFSSLKDRCLELRLVPTDFDLDTVEPVLNIVVGNIENLETLEEKLGLLREYCVYDVQADGSILLLWCEEAEAPVEFAGTVTWTKEAYHASDYVDRIRVIEERNSDSWSEVRDLHGRIHNTLGFIDRALDRLQRRLEFSAVKNPSVEQQIRLLTSVRRQLEDD